VEQLFPFTVGFGKPGAPVTSKTQQMLLNKLVRLASSPDNIIPGHDSTVLHPLTGRCRLNLTFRKALV
jgi:hypothetical protein